ncbi:MAG: choice-of-anchor T family protein [Thermoplasmatota archaeon]
MRSPSIIILTLVSVTFFLVMLFFPEGSEAEAVGGAEVNIIFDSTRIFVDLDPGMGAVLTLNGTVSVNVPWIPEIQELIVNLNTTIDNISASITDKLIFTKGITDLPFHVIINIPTDLSGVFRLTACGNWSYDPGVHSGDCEEDVALIYVNEHPEITLGCDKPYEDVARGESVTYLVTISNNGDVDEFVNLSVTNLDDLNSAEMVVQMSQQKFQIPPNVSSNVSIRVSTSPRTPLDTYPVELCAENMNPLTHEGTGVFIEYTLFIEVVVYDDNPQPPSGDDDEPDDGDSESDEEENETIANGEIADADLSETSKDYDGTTQEDSKDSGFPVYPVVGFMAAFVLILAAVVIWNVIRKKKNSTEKEEII